MIVDDTTDVEQRAGFIFIHLPQELVGLFGIGLPSLCVRVEPVGGIERVFQKLFELINRANPVLHAVRSNGSRLALNIGNEIFPPLFRTAIVANGIVGDKLKHTFWQNIVYQVFNMSWLMPDKRPTDNMELAVDLPQEEEFALGNMMPYTYYNFWFLPKHQLEYADKYLLFDNITEAELKVFEETFIKLIKISLWNTHGTQFLSKNPPHTGRVKELVKMFPNAKFIYLMRNPYTVFESTRSFFTNTIQPLKLQDISNEELERNILSIYAKLYHKYETDKKDIPLGNLIEVKFEDFEADVMGMTEHIYNTLSIPGYTEARADIEKYVGKKKGYKKNKYKYDDRTVKLVQDSWSFALEQWKYEL